MGLTAKQDFMMVTLSAMLEAGEMLKYPFYGALNKLGAHKAMQFGFFGLAGNTLLIAILDPLDANDVLWAARVPLQVKTCRVKKSLVPRQFHIRMTLENGDDLDIQVSKKLIAGDFREQADHVTAFLAHLESFRQHNIV